MADLHAVSPLVCTAVPRTQALPVAAPPRELPSEERLLARNLFRRLRAHGYEPTEIATLAAALIGEVTADLSPRDQ